MLKAVPLCGVTVQLPERGELLTLITSCGTTCIRIRAWHGDARGTAAGTARELGTDLFAEASVRAKVHSKAEDIRLAG